MDGHQGERRQRKIRGPGTLLGQLRDPNPLVRRWGARDLAAYAGAPAALLEQLGQENDDTVREVILATLATVGGNSVARGLLPFLESEDAGLRNGAAQALTHMAREAIPLLSPFLAHRKPGVRQLALAILEQAPPDQALPLLLRQLATETHPAVMASLLQTLGVLGGEEHIPLVEQAVASMLSESFVAFAAGRIRCRLQAKGETLSGECLREVRDLAMKHTGLEFGPEDHAAFERLFQRQRRALGLANARSWLALLDRVDHWHLWQEIVGELRPLPGDPHQWRQGIAPLLPKLIPERSRGTNRPLRIWCHSANSGMESHALAHALHPVGESLSVVMSSFAPLAAATPPQVGATGDRWQEEAREFQDQGMEFQDMDLANPGQGKRFRGFDLVVCRGILPRLPPLSRRQAAILFFDALLPGGFLVLGRGEGMGNVSSLFKVRTFPGGMAYQKPGAP